MDSNPLDETQPTTSRGDDATQPVPAGQPVSTGEEPPAEQAASEQAAQEQATTEEPAPKQLQRKRSLSWIGWSLLGILLLGLVAAGSSYGGYLSAIEERRNFQVTQVALEAQAQYDLGVQDMQAGRYDLARQRFEYVINLDPGFPGVADRLAEVLLALVSTATPTTAPTPTLTPTPDLRGREELFTQAQAYMLAGDWSAAIETLLTLRKRDPTYLAVKIDGMLFVALRNRGVDKIARQADLEGGTYDLALAERFGPLDVEARNWRDWAELYIRGASFWGVDWPQAVFYFSQLAPIAPYLTDGSGFTATDRYRLALLGYGDWLAQQEKWCEARDQYQTALNLSADPVVQPTADYVWNQCENPTPEGPPIIEPTQGTPTLATTPALGTPTPTLPVLEATPTETPPTPYP